MVWLLTGGVVCAAAASLALPALALFALVVSLAAGAEIALVLSVAPAVAAPVVPPVVLAMPGFALLPLLSQVAATSFTSETVRDFSMEDCAEVAPEAVLVAVDDAVAASWVPVTETLCPTSAASWLSLPESL